MNLKDGQSREEWLESLSDGSWTQHHDQLLECFDIELKQRLNEDDEETFENLYHCALYLFLIGDVKDSIMLYDAKFSDFDLGCGLDYQYLLGAGVDPTISYAKSIKRFDIVDYLDELKKSSDFKEDTDFWCNYKRGYFGLPID